MFNHRIIFRFLSLIFIAWMFFWLTNYTFSQSTNVTDREGRCGLAAWTLNDTTVSCVNQNWTDPCCLESSCRTQLWQWQSQPSLQSCNDSSATCWAWKKMNWSWKCVCDSAQTCCGIQLNTVVPFIWDCIEMSNDPSAGNTTRVNALTAFPILMWWLSKMIITAILIFSFVMIVVWWILIIAWWISQSNYKQWIDIIKKVIIALALLWASWIILRLINPNFFW